MPIFIQYDLTKVGLFIFLKNLIMNSFFKTLIAGYGAKKLGGGCFSTILVFIVIYWALGTCNRPAQPLRQPTGIYAPADSAKALASTKY